MTPWHGHMSSFLLPVLFLLDPVPSKANPMADLLLATRVIVVFYRSVYVKLVCITESHISSLVLICSYRGIKRTTIRHSPLCNCVWYNTSSNVMNASHRDILLIPNMNMKSLFGTQWVPYVSCLIWLCLYNKLAAGSYDSITHIPRGILKITPGPVKHPWV